MGFEITKNLADQIIRTMEEVCGHNINFIDQNGKIYASTNQIRVGDFHEIGLQVVKTGKQIEVFDDNAFDGTKKGINIPIFYHNEVIAVIGISGEPSEVKKYTRLATRITTLLMREQDLGEQNRTKSEKCNYIVRCLVNETIENREYFNQCLREVGIKKKEEMSIVIIKVDTSYDTLNLSFMEQKIRFLFQANNVPIYSYTYPNEFIALLRREKKEEVLKNFHKFAREQEYTLKIGVGAEYPLGKLSRSYENAKTALKSIENSLNLFAEFEKLDLEILLQDISKNNKEMYLEKTVKELSEAEKELLAVYYEENMSLQNTYKRLFLHKNTLQYKLDRIYKKCGYNPRKFKDAVLLYLALQIDR